MQNNGPDPNDQALLEEQNNLRARKLEVDAQINELNLAIRDAKMRFATTRRRTEPCKYARWLTQLARFKRESQSLQFDLAECRTKLTTSRSRTLAEHFVEVARLKLGSEQFAALMHAAFDRLDTLETLTASSSGAAEKRCYEN
jgi:hypothetical protein